MHHQAFVRPLIVLAWLAAAGTAQAQAWFAGASGGQVTQHSYSVGGPIAHSHDTDTAVRVFGGYHFYGPFSAVLSYVDLGTPTYDGPAWGGFNDSLKASAIDLSMVVGFTPGAQEVFTPFFTIGTFQFTQDVHYRDATGPYDYRDSGTRLSYGIGAQFHIGSLWAAHIGWQRFKKVGDLNNSGHEYDRDLIETGFEYRFGH